MKYLKLRKLILALLSALLLCTAVSAAEYTDLSETHWAREQILYLQDEIQGYPDGTFQPESAVTRAEFLTLFVRVAYPKEYQAQSSTEWWRPAYDICEAHGLLDGITGSRTEAMPRGEIAALLGRYCQGWGGVNERASASDMDKLVINWTEQRMESPERRPLFSDTEKYEQNSDTLMTCANQGLLTGYPDGSFKPANGITRAEASAVIARLKAQLALREKGCKYICSVGKKYWLMQCETEKALELALYEPYTGKLRQTILSRDKAKGNTDGMLAAELLSGSDGMYVWGSAGLYKRSGDTLEQITDDHVLDFCWQGDTQLYYLSWEKAWDLLQAMPAYSGGGAYYPCATQVKLLEITSSGNRTTLLAERDASNFMQNLTNIYVENGKVYAAGSYFMGMADWHAALYEVKDGKLTVVFGEY